MSKYANNKNISNEEVFRKKYLTLKNKYIQQGGYNIESDNEYIININGVEYSFIVYDSFTFKNDNELKQKLLENLDCTYYNIINILLDVNSSVKLVNTPITKQLAAIQSARSTHNESSYIPYNIISSIKYNRCIMPISICVLNGKIYMADIRNNCIHIIDILSGKNTGIIGNDQFDYPQCVCITKQGTLFVADMNNECIQIFDTNNNNRFIQSINKHNSKQTELWNPRQVCCNDNKLFVANYKYERGNYKGNVQVFNIENYTYEYTIDKVPLRICVYEDTLFIAPYVNEDKYIYI
jgi:hypothetical protein